MSHAQGEEAAARPSGPTSAPDGGAGRRYGSVRLLERRTTYPVEGLLARLASLPTPQLELDGVAVDAQTLKLRCFATHGVRCAACGLEAVRFALERIESSAFAGWVLNLYAERDGREVLFKKDHVRPVSRGGPDTLESLQPMCWPCNGRKGDREP